MSEKTKAVDCLVFRPRLRPQRADAGRAVEAESADGRGGIMSLFPGVADRLANPGTDEDLVAAMDAAGVEKGLVVVYDEEDKEWAVEAMSKYPGRFLLRVRINPIQNGMPANYLILAGASLVVLIATVVVFDRTDLT